MAYSEAFRVLSLLSLLLLISSEVSARKLAESTTTTNKDTSMFFTAFLLLVFWGWNPNEKTFDKLYIHIFDIL